LPPVLHTLTLVFAATEGEESSKSLFYLAGGLLAVFAVVVSAIGIKGIDSFPKSKGQARGVIGLAAVLVLFAAASAIITG
jgi:hypothetical protein